MWRALDARSFKLSTLSDASLQVQDSLALLAQDDRRTLSSYCTALLTLLITAHGAALGSTNGSELQHARGKLRRDQGDPG